MPPTVPRRVRPALRRRSALRGICAAAFSATAFVVTIAGPVRAQEGPIRSGPMVGYSEMREVLLWVQTRREADVRFVYWDEDVPGTRWKTDVVRTRAGDAFVAKAVLPLLEPGTRYSYRVEVDGGEAEVGWPLRFQTQALWQWRTDPPDFRIVAASCFYVNDPPYDRYRDPYGDEFEILDAVRAAAPDAMLWLGDNVYLRPPDWYTRSGMLYRYTHTRSFPGLQPLLGSVHHYAIWDDHDYGPDNSDWTWREKATAKEVFDLFWGNPEPGPPEFGGITTSFQWGDVEFFLLDDRWHRSSEHRQSGKRAMLGDEQLRWLVDALASSRATFKIVATGGQVLNPDARWESYATFPEERAELLEALRANDIRGVLFLTGDVHYSVLSKLERRGTYPLYDLTVSPLTAGPTDTDEARNLNHLRLPGTLYAGRSFATLDVRGPRTDRVLTIAIRDVAGREVWSREVRASELR